MSTFEPIAARIDAIRVEIEQKQAELVRLESLQQSLGKMSPAELAELGKLIKPKFQPRPPIGTARYVLKALHAFPNGLTMRDICETEQLAPLVAVFPDKEKLREAVSVALSRLKREGRTDNPNGRWVLNSNEKRNSAHA